MLKKFVKTLLKSRYSYSPLVKVEISKDNLLHNINEFRAIAPKYNGRGSIAPVLKSNAYGHGLVQIADILEKEHFPFLIVDSYFEALALRTNGIKTPLLILGYTPVQTIMNNKLKDICFTIISLDTLAAFSHSSHAPHSVNLKIDSGMSRQGILPHEIEKAAALIKSNPSLTLLHISSHLADADNQDSTFTELQIKRWNTAVTFFKKEFPRLQFWHTSATSGHFYTEHINANISRCGLGMYGLQTGGPVDSRVHLKPVLELQSQISGIKKISKGDKVGYGGTFTAEKHMTLATLPLGYFEGVDRRLSNKGYVKIGTHMAPIVGRVSMNITTIDITDIHNVSVNTPVTVISSNPEDKNSVESIAQLCGTIPYEIVVHVASTLQRVVK